MGIKSEVEVKFKELVDVNPNHVNNLKLYSGFQDLIFNDREKSKALEEK